MAIGSCTSCQPTGNNVIYAVSEQQKLEREQRFSQIQLERQQAKVNFSPDPSRVLDILA